jgi:hypothetical protein
MQVFWSDKVELEGNPYGGTLHVAGKNSTVCVVLPIDLLAKHARYVLEGDYGSGKSMTLRELFFQAVDNYKQGRTRQFPIFLNRRDHGGADDPAEAFDRHGRRVGIDNERHLNRA